MSSFILLPLSNGQAAASLTAIEFIIGLLVVWGIETLIAGTWLLLLHRRKKVSFESYRSYPRNQLSHKRLTFFLTLLITGLLAAFVAILESRLEDKFGISPETASTTRWVRMNESVDSTPGFVDSPPQNFKLDPKSIDVAQVIDCEYGIDTLSFESSSNGKGLVTLDEEASILVPICRVEQDTSIQNITGIENDFSKELTFYYRSHQYLTFSEEKSFVFPYKPSDLNTITNQGKNISVAKNCKTKNISTISTASRPYGVAFDIGGMSEYATSQMVLSKICEKHEERSVTFNRRELENKLCVINGFGDSMDIDHGCVLNYYSKYNLDTFNVTLDDMSVLFTYYRPRNQMVKSAVLCSDATVQYEYVLVPSALVKSKPKSKQNTIIPINWKVINGRCENTYYPLGLSALIYSTYAEWNPNNLGKLKDIPRHQRYHAYLESLARLNFPFDAKIGASNVRENVTFQTTETKTLVKLDLTFYLLISAMITSFIIITVSLLYQIFIPKEAWKASFVKDAIVKINQDLHPTGNISITSSHKETPFPDDYITLKPVQGDKSSNPTQLTFLAAADNKTYQIKIE